MKVSATLSVNSSNCAMQANCIIIYIFFLFVSVAQGTIFKVPSGSLGFGVTVFTVCAVITIAIIYARRYLKVFGKAELGGPTGPKWASGMFIFSLWILYIILASMQNYGHIKGF